MPETKQQTKLEVSPVGLAVPTLPPYTGGPLPKDELEALSARALDGHRRKPPVPEPNGGFKTYVRLFDEGRVAAILEHHGDPLATAYFGKAVSDLAGKYPSEIVFVIEGYHHGRPASGPTMRLALELANRYGIPVVNPIANQASWNAIQGTVGRLAEAYSNVDVSSLVLGAMVTQWSELRAKVHKEVSTHDMPALVKLYDRSWGAAIESIGGVEALYRAVSAANGAFAIAPETLDRFMGCFETYSSDRLKGRQLNVSSLCEVTAFLEHMVENGFSRDVALGGLLQLTVPLSEKDAPDVTPTMDMFQKRWGKDAVTYRHLHDGILAWREFSGASRATATQFMADMRDTQRLVQNELTIEAFSGLADRLRNKHLIVLAGFVHEAGVIGGIERIK